jgi:hypothetical protein
MSNPPAPSWIPRFPQEDMAEAPLPPPASVTDVVPAFHLHGDYNCGDHRYNIDSQHFQKWILRQNRDRSTAWNLSCSNCHTRVTLNQVHDLPCGDLVCCSCLNSMALNVKRSIERNRTRIQDARVKIQEIDIYLSKRPLSMDSQVKRERKIMSRRRADLSRSIIHLSGSSCCGIAMKLGRFLPCLSPEVSRDLWLDYQWLRDPLRAQRSCAWPDCCAYMPTCCRYPVPGSLAGHYYCVTCQGNSMDCARELPAAQTRFPWLPRGQPALTPCR